MGRKESIHYYIHCNKREADADDNINKSSEEYVPLFFFFSYKFSGCLFVCWLVVFFFTRGQSFRTSLRQKRYRTSSCSYRMIRQSEANFFHSNLRPRPKEHGAEDKPGHRANWLQIGIELDRLLLLFFFFFFFLSFFLLSSVHTINVNIGLNLPHDGSFSDIGRAKQAFALVKAQVENPALKQEILARILDLVRVALGDQVRINGIAFDQHSEKFGTASRVQKLNGLVLRIYREN